MNHSTANINISNGPHQAEHQTDSEIENDSVGDNCDSDDESILTLENFYLATNSKPSIWKMRLKR